MALALDGMANAAIDRLAEHIIHTMVEEAGAEGLDIIHLGAGGSETPMLALHTALSVLQTPRCRVHWVANLDGATIDCADTIEQQGFTIDNPNAQGSCACGDSFH